MNLHALRAVLNGIAQTVGQTIAETGTFDPRPGSQAAAELAAEAQFVPPGATAIGRPVLDAYTTALSRLVGAHDQFKSMARALEDEPLTFGPAALARTALEGCARAWWMFDPALDVRARVARGLTERFKNMREVMKYPLPAIPAQVGQRLDLVIREAEAAGFTVTRGARKIYIDKPLPEATDVIRTQLGDRGVLAYRDLSGVSHGMIASLTSRMERAGGVPTEPGVAMMRPAADPTAILATAAVVLEGFFLATDRRFALYGADVTLWKAWKTEARRMLSGA